MEFTQKKYKDDVSVDTHQIVQSIEKWERYGKKIKDDDCSKKKRNDVFMDTHLIIQSINKWEGMEK